MQHPAIRAVMQEFHQHTLHLPIGWPENPLEAAGVCRIFLSSSREEVLPFAVPPKWVQGKNRQSWL